MRTDEKFGFVVGGDMVLASPEVRVFSVLLSLCDVVVAAVC
jgi:hypothetical protein